MVINMKVPEKYKQDTAHSLAHQKKIRLSVAANMLPFDPHDSQTHPQLEESTTYPSGLHRLFDYVRAQGFPKPYQPQDLGLGLYLGLGL